MRLPEADKIVHVEDRYSLHYGSTPVTVLISLWHYHGPRVRIKFVEGSYSTLEEIETAVREKGKDPNVLIILEASKLLRPLNTCLK